MPFADGTRIANRCQGILIGEVSEAEAQRIVTGLGELSIPAARRAVSELLPLPAAVDCRRMAVDRERFMPELSPGAEAGEWPWEDVAVFCVGEVETETVTRKAAPGTPGGVRLSYGLTALTGIPVVVPGAQGSQQRQGVTTSALLMDIVALRPTMRFRVNALRFDYTLLGPRKSLSHKPNFVALSRLLRSLARSAASNYPSSDAGAGGEAWEKFDEMPQYEARVRWLLQVSDAR